jgi:hypothetical protein
MNQVVPADTGYRDMISRAAADPNFDLDKFERLCALQEAQEQRAADRDFNAALSAAEAEMSPISADANNPQTRSRYATFARLDGVARPIYTRHGFGISFTTEQTGSADSIMVVGTLSHRMGGSRRYQILVPITTKGIQGREMMTPVHATMSAISYGKRNLEIMMFNLAVGDDDDGNSAGGRRPPPQPHNPNATVNPVAPNEYLDPVTGEVVSLAHRTPGVIEWMKDVDTWQTWGSRFIAHLRTSTTLDEVQQWQDLNTSQLQLMTAEKPATAANMQSAITAFKATLS